ncbi:hypothetical protein mflW37_3140 [Mesoplasma florum W37]|uniref:Uncharacterized protein n=1 Tax=Mesoplasma florum TaxID=2151 RepID=A0AAD2JDR4_MESFO|nr:hypothetical protein [Mesoplasma florum]AGY41381.1 hypothetical protein mflW37_3140 [Mesoplasma florum W37]AVN59604.1 hypothetical protein CG008_01640 [Mesoplasma florum]AVN65721.1 hypothetical protein MflW12_3160 [Mesoplasma florum]
MSRKINTWGGGNRTNLNGLAFEQKINLVDSFENSNIFNLVINKKGYKEVFLKKNNKFVGFVGIKSKLYKVLEDKFPNETFLVEGISKLQPDGFFLNCINKTLYIIENKYQNGSGSVDEKIQTGVFKKIYYMTLMRETDYKVQYMYVLNYWFSKKNYDFVKKYLVDNNIKVFMENLPIEELGL